MSAFPSNSPYLTEYPTMTPFGSSGSLQLMLTLLSEIPLYVSLDTGPGTDSEEVGKKWGVNNCRVYGSLYVIILLQIARYVMINMLVVYTRLTTIISLVNEIKYQTLTIFQCCKLNWIRCKWSCSIHSSCCHSPLVGCVRSEVGEVVTDTSRRTEVVGWEFMSDVPLVVLRLF